MAKDILSVPISTIASESSFSLGSRVLTKWRASLKPENVETLVTTRSWIFDYEVDKDDNLIEDGVEFPFNPAINELHDVDEEEDNADFDGDEDEDAIFVLL